MNGALKSLQLLIGILAGLLGLMGILGGAGYYFFVTQMSNRPPKPVFAEEQSGSKPVTAKPKPKPKPITAKPTASPAATIPADPDAPLKLPPEAYDAKVLWKDGLSLKKEPDPSAQKLGGVAFNAKVAIIKTSADKQWVLIQSQIDNRQGWVKAGNIDKAAAAATDTPAAAKPTVKPRARNRARVRPPAAAEN
ncbi:SH3 domain-containing protein [Chamaesiphon sp.]|uniref:SH3 domain-containing protein n=1 Tax=Chamaesiphon sp. TaxID=2814140 RepID=UPI003593994A